MEQIKKIQVDALVVLKMLKNENGVLLGVDYEDLLIITNAVPDESYAAALQELHFESNIVGFFSTEDLKLLIDTQVEKQKQIPNCIGIQIENGQIFGFRLREKYLKHKEGRILERIPISIKNSSLIDAALLEIKTPESEIKNVNLQEITELVELLQQDSWKQSHKKKKNELKIVSEHIKLKCAF